MSAPLNPVAAFGQIPQASKSKQPATLPQVADAAAAHASYARTGGSAPSEAFERVAWLLDENGTPNMAPAKPSPGAKLVFPIHLGTTASVRIVAAPKGWFTVAKELAIKHRPLLRIPSRTDDPTGRPADVLALLARCKADTPTTLDPQLCVEVRGEKTTKGPATYVRFVYTDRRLFIQYYFFFVDRMFPGPFEVKKFNPTYRPGLWELVQLELVRLPGKTGKTDFRPFTVAVVSETGGEARFANKTAQEDNAKQFHLYYGDGWNSPLAKWQGDRPIVYVARMSHVLLLQEGRWAANRSVGKHLIARPASAYGLMIHETGKTETCDLTGENLVFVQLPGPEPKEGTRPEDVPPHPAFWFGWKGQYGTAANSPYGPQFHQSPILQRAWTDPAGLQAELLTRHYTPAPNKQTHALVYTAGQVTCVEISPNKCLRGNSAVAVVDAEHLPGGAFWFTADTGDQVPATGSDRVCFRDSGDGEVWLVAANDQGKTSADKPPARTIRLVDKAASQRVFHFIRKGREKSGTVVLEIL